MSGGLFKFPIIIRVGIAHGLGVQHSDDYSNILASFTGLNIAAITNPYNAKGIMNEAFSSNSPTIVIEDTLLHHKNMPAYLVPKIHYKIDKGTTEIVKNGKDLTIVCFGTYIEIGLEAALQLEKYNIYAEVININWIVPINYENIFNSIKKTKRVILLNQGFERMNIMKEISQTIITHNFEILLRPPIVLGAKNLVNPNGNYDKYIYPQVNDILSVINDHILEIKNFDSNNYLNKKDDILQKSKGM